MKWTPYNVTFCCPDIFPDCDRVTPVVDFFTQPPLTIGGATGTIQIVFRGLNTRYNVLWQDGFQQNVVTQTTRNNLASGDYSITVTSLTNPDCSWTYIVTVPPFLTLNAEVYYAQAFITPVPTLPNFTPTNVEAYRYNVDRVLNPNDQIIAFQLVVTGGTLPYTYLWEDWNDYGALPANHITPITPAQTPVIPANNVRPPLQIGGNNFIVGTYDVVPNNGNGWVRAIVTDSSVPQLQRIFWIYIMQSPLP